MADECLHRLSLGYRIAGSSHRLKPCCPDSDCKWASLDGSDATKSPGIRGEGESSGGPGTDDYIDAGWGEKQGY